MNIFIVEFTVTSCSELEYTALLYYHEICCLLGHSDSEYHYTAR